MVTNRVSVQSLALLRKVFFSVQPSTDLRQCPRGLGASTHRTHSFSPSVDYLCLYKQSIPLCQAPGEIVTSADLRHRRGEKRQALGTDCKSYIHSLAHPERTQNQDIPPEYQQITTLTDFEDKLLAEIMNGY